MHGRSGYIHETSFRASLGSIIIIRLGVFYSLSLWSLYSRAVKCAEGVAAEALSVIFYYAVLSMTLVTAVTSTRA